MNHLCLGLLTETTLFSILTLEPILVLPDLIKHLLAFSLDQALLVSHILSLHQVSMSTLKVFHHASSFVCASGLAHQLLIFFLASLLKFKMRFLLPALVNISLFFVFLYFGSSLISSFAHYSAFAINFLQCILFLEFVPLHYSFALCIVEYFIILIKIHCYIFQKSLLMIIPQSRLAWFIARLQFTLRFNIKFTLFSIIRFEFFSSDCFDDFLFCNFVDSCVFLNFFQLLLCSLTKSMFNFTLSLSKVEFLRVLKSLCFKLNQFLLVSFGLFIFNFSILILNLLSFTCFIFFDFLKVKNFLKSLNFVCVI